MSRSKGQKDFVPHPPSPQYSSRPHFAPRGKNLPISQAGDFFQTNSHTMCTVCTGHVTLADTLYIIVDLLYFFIFQKTTLEAFVGICGELLQTSCIRLWLLLSLEVWCESTCLCINYLFTVVAAHLVAGSHSHINFQNSVLMKLPACQATNEAKLWFSLFSGFLSDLDLKPTLNSGMLYSKNAGNIKFRNSCGLWIIKHYGCKLGRASSSIQNILAKAKCWRF